MASRSNEQQTSTLKKTSSLAYVNGLEPKAKSIYLEKLSLCDGVDPYTLKNIDFSTDFNELPGLQFPDISNYLVVQTSFYTKNQMKAFKSLEAYNFFVCGWVHDVGVRLVKDDNRLVFARVNHSQRSTATPLKTWVIVKGDGEVLTGHCTCMAGLAESCSHIGALLYFIEAAVRMHESVTCTMEKCKWLMPAHVKKINAAPVSNIDFSSAKAKKQRLDKAINGESPEEIQTPNPASCPIVLAGTDEYNNFFKELSINYPKSAALMTKHSYYKSFIPKSATQALPKPIMSYRSDTTLELPYDQLMDRCKELKLSLNEDQIAAVELETRKQSGSRVWFTQRACRITASRLKDVLSTNPENPSKSLIKYICYPEAHRFSNNATRHGCKHESQARNEYEAIMTSQHENFIVCDSGLRINSKWPFMGASPDGVAKCDCCGVGTVEIKCPYCHRDKENIEDCADKKGFCLRKNDKGDVQLDRKHKYYFQVQAQLNIMDIDYCDFIVWNENDIFIERIIPDEALWDTITPKAELFFRNCILPEVLGKHFSKPTLSNLQPQNHLI